MSLQLSEVKTLTAFSEKHYGTARRPLVLNEGATPGVRNEWISKRIPSFHTRLISSNVLCRETGERLIIITHMINCSTTWREALETQKTIYLWRRNSLSAWTHIPPVHLSSLEMSLQSLALRIPLYYKLWTMRATRMSETRLTTTISDMSVSAKASEQYRTPDFLLFKGFIEGLGKDVEISAELPFAIFEIKPPEGVRLSRSLSSYDLHSLRGSVNRTRSQADQQLAAFWQEYAALEDQIPFVFIFICIGKYFSNYKVKFGDNECLDAVSLDQIHCIFDKQEEDFSDAFKKCWQDMMDTYRIPILNHFL